MPLRLPDFATLPRASITREDPFLEGVRYRFPTPTRRLRKRALRMVTKEPGTVRWLHETLCPTDVFLDVGANVGVYSLLAAARLDRGRVYACEPHAPTFAALLANLAANPCGSRIVPLSVAIGSGCGWQSFRYAELGAGTTGGQIAESAVAAQHSLIEEPKPVAGIDDLVDAGVVEQPTVVKIDVDGNEPAVLDGMAGTLRDPRLRSVQVEAAPERRLELIARLEDAGFALTDEHYSRQGTVIVRRGGVYTPNLVFRRATSAAA